jgi:predicted MFS family arabinose efflux permease
VLIPQYVKFLVEHYGWRIGYIGLGAALFVLAFIPVALLFAEPEEMKSAREVARRNGTGDNSALPGITLSEALRNRKYWILTMAIFLSLMVTSGSLAHMVPMFTDRGIPVDTAVAALSISGAAMAIGRLISGYLMDKIFAIYVAMFFLVVPMVGIAILLASASKFWLVVAVVLIGLLIGAEFDVMAFLVSRYFGIRAFGVLYGFMLMFVEAANAVGMLLMGWCFQLRHSYVPMLCAFEFFLVVAVVLMFSMGPYRYPAPKAQRETVALTH